MNLKIALLTSLITAPAAVTAFVPRTNFADLRGSFEETLLNKKKAVTSETNLQSSRAEQPTTTELRKKENVSSSSSSTQKSHQQQQQQLESSDGYVLPRHAAIYKRWGRDFENTGEYWLDSRIHTLGNCGFWGGVHAALAPVSTKLIDNIAYDGVDIRKVVAKELRESYKISKARVLDLCCGVGFSTRALQEAFSDAEMVVGLDTSSEMLSMARFISDHVAHLKPWFGLFYVKTQDLIEQGKKLRDDAKQFVSSTEFKRANAEKTPFAEKSFDVVTIMYAFHEAPKHGRERILQEARRVLNPGGILAVIDISSNYEPSENMLAGEPYVLEYQKNIHKQLRTQKGFSFAKHKSLVPGHVDMWVLKRNPV